MTSLLASPDLLSIAAMTWWRESLKDCDDPRQFFYRNIYVAHPPQLIFVQLIPRGRLSPFSQMGWQLFPWYFFPCGILSGQGGLPILW